MKGTERLHAAGQSLWLDYISRDLLNSGTLKRYIDEFSVTGLTSNPSIFDQAINSTTAYDAAIRRRLHDSTSVEESFFGVALEDISRAAELFLRIHERTNRVDGWVSLELSPLLAHDTGRSVSRARELFERAGLQNLFIKIPGTREGLGVIEESIFAGIPVNVTLLFSREQYLAAADAYLRGIERRIAAGLNPEVASVASVFISRWDVAVAKRVSPQLRDRLGIATDQQTYALPWLLHLAGDVHQPLHVIQRFTRDFPRGDRGGNAVRLRGTSNLHSYWDSRMGTSQTERFLAQLVETIERRHPAPRQIDLNPAHWADESFKLKDQVYAFTGRGTEESPVALSDAYAVGARDIAYVQAAMAGYRLAQLLNEQFR